MEIEMVAFGSSVVGRGVVRSCLNFSCEVVMSRNIGQLKLSVKENRERYGIFLTSNIKRIRSVLKS
jgi:hypothetical protein